MPAADAKKGDGLSSGDGPSAFFAIFYSNVLCIIALQNSLTCRYLRIGN